VGLRSAAVAELAMPTSMSAMMLFLSIFILQQEMVSRLPQAES
jgi:hypothetical protein